MNAVATPLVRLREHARTRALPLSGTARVTLLLLGLVAVSLLLRTSALHSRYWIDEALSVGIASHDLRDIPSVLRQDGAPPVYYALLHVWISVFGQGEADTHMLSVLCAMATVPVSFVLGRALFGLRAGIAAAVLFALNPFLTYYAQETRMYALLALLSVCVAGSFALAFGLGRPGWRWAFAASLALMLYSHNWGIFVGIGAAVALAALWWDAQGGERAALLRQALPVFGVVALVYVPWVPTLLFQARHTAAPWSERPPPTAMWNTLSAVLGGAAPAMAFTLAGLSGLSVLLARTPSVRRARLSPEGRAVLALLVMFVVGVFAAWLASQPNPAWATRYVAAVLGPLFLLAGVALSRASWMGTLVLVLIAVFWLDARTPHVNSKSNAHAAAVDVEDRLYPGDLVVAAHPEYGPAMHLYLPPGLRWANTLGPVSDPTVMDWRDALERLRAARPKATSDALVRSLGQGRRLVLVMPLLRSARWGAPWTKLVRRRALQWERRLDRDTRLVRTLAVPRLRGHALPRGVRIVLYERVPDGTGGIHAASRPDPRDRR